MHLIDYIENKDEVCCKLSGEGIYFEIFNQALISSFLTTMGNFNPCAIYLLGYFFLQFFNFETS